MACYKEVEKGKGKNKVRIPYVVLTFDHLVEKKCPHEERSGKEETREAYLTCGYMCCIGLIVM